jgi:hypothetical protein
VRWNIGVVGEVEQLAFPARRTLSFMKVAIEAEIEIATSHGLTLI